MNIITLPENVSMGDPFSYSDILRMGEDDEYFYLFRNEHGGYMVPKAELKGKEDDFRAFMVGITGKDFRARVAPVFKLLRKLDVNKRLKKL